MSGNLQLAWSVPRDSDLDVKDFTLQLLEGAKDNLQRDGELLSVAFVVTPDQLQCYSITFQDQEEKDTVYHELIQAAKKADASALITCNDAYWKEKTGPQDLEGYYPGKLAAEGAKECVMVTLSGPLIETWCVEVPYQRSKEGITFGAHSESFGGHVGFLEGWSAGKPTIN